MCGSNNPMKNFKIVNIFTPNNLHKCQSGEYILKTLICDNTFNCPTMDDELNCTKCDGLNNEIWNITCSVQLNNHIQKYLNEQIRKWKFPYLNKNNRANKINGTYFTCKDGTNISQHLVLDLYPDCPGTQAEDELLNSTMIIRDIIGNGHLFKEHSSIPCVKGHPKCYKKEKLCIYELDAMGHLKHRRNGAHLGECDNHACNDSYKCPGYYCIPFHYVCDGKRDCPYGCDGLLQCIKSNICVYFTNICDGVNDCQHGDDEQLCDVKICPDGCSCWLYIL